MKNPFRKVSQKSDEQLLREIQPASRVAQFGAVMSCEDRRYYAVADELFARGYRATGRGTWEK